MFSQNQEVFFSIADDNTPFFTSEPNKKEVNFAILPDSKSLQLLIIEVNCFICSRKLFMSYWASSSAATTPQRFTGGSLALSSHTS